MSQKLNAAIAVIGIDIGKNSFHIVGHDHRGAIVLLQKWSTRDAPSSASRRRRRRPSAEECGCVATVPFFLRRKAFCDSRLLLALCKSISTGRVIHSQLILSPVAAGCNVQRPFRAMPAKYRTALSEPQCPL